MGFPAGCIRMAFPISVQLCTGMPPILTILSPARTPAFLAGDAGSLAVQPEVRFAGTQVSIAPTAVVLLAVSRPTPAATTTSKNSASTKCMNDPALSTMIRCHPGLRRNDRGSSAGSTSSRSVIPTIFTNPPAGIALMPYSVSPFLRDQSVCPNPTKNWVAFIPNSLAVAKCPASCSMTEMRSATTKMATPSRKLICLPPSRALGLGPRWPREAGPRRRDTATAPGGASCRRRARKHCAAFGPAPAAWRRDRRRSTGAVSPLQPSPLQSRAHHVMRAEPPGSSQFRGPGPCPPVGGTYIGQGHRVPLAAIGFRDYLRHRVHDSGEGELARHKGVHAHLVGGVVDGRGGASGLPGLPGDRDRGKGLLVKWLEGPGVCGRPVDGWRGPGNPVRPAQGERDGNPHIGRAGLGERGSVGELDHRVDDRLRVDDHRDLVEPEPEQQVGLDDLKPLVDKRGAVDRDDGAHVPGGMGECLLRGDAVQLRAAAAAERAAAGGQHELRDLLGLT